MHNKIEGFFFFFDKKQSYQKRKMQYKVHNVLEILQELQAMVNEPKIFSLKKGKKKRRITQEQ